MPGRTVALIERLERRLAEQQSTEEEGSAEDLDAASGFDLWCVLVTHEWFTAHLHNRVRDLVGRWGGNWEDVKDLMQDLVIQLRLDMQAKPTMGLDLKRAEHTFRPWLNRIIHNISVDLAESHFSRRLAVEQGTEPQEVAGEFAGFDDVEISQLPDPDRTAATLRIERHELKEIAAEMQITVDRVRTILARVRKQLRRLLGDH